MKGAQIFLHSVRQVMNNLPAAIQISGALYLAQAVLGLIFGASMMSTTGMDPASMGANFGFGVLIMLVAAALVGIWVAVAWHRYVLLAENPGAILPAFMGDRMGAYFVKSLLIAVILIVGGMVIGAIGGIVIAPIMMQGGMIIGLLLITVLVQIPMIFIGLRLATALPAAALGVSLPFMAGWQATTGEWRAILQLAVIMGLVLWVINLTGVFVFGGFGMMAQLWQFIIGWPVMMIGLSILTTLYGHYIEKRPLV